MHRYRKAGHCLLAFFFLGIVITAKADEYVWNGATTATGDWFNTSNWLPARAPTNAGDTVKITNGFVLLTNSSAALGSLTISNASLIFSNWTTALNADEVTIRDKGIFTLPSAFTNNQMSNRVWVICTNLTIDAGGKILADERGYAKASGPACGTNSTQRYRASGGGGYGGKGGAGGGWKYYTVALGGDSYGSANAPLGLGSGGGGNLGGTPLGGDGGGAVRIVANGTVTVSGIVSANGGNGARIYNDTPCGGGSGGSIYITCATFGGNNSGILQANGGNGAIGTDLSYMDIAGGGGGGRIAVEYRSLSGAPGVQFSANYGTGWTNVDFNAPGNWMAPQVGTLWFTNTALLDSFLSSRSGIASGLNGYFIFQSTNSWAPYLLVLSNSTLGVLDGSTLRITNDLTMTTTGSVVVVGHAICPSIRISC